MLDAGLSATSRRASAPFQAIAAVNVRQPHICFVAPEAWPVFSGNTDIAVVGGAEVQQGILARLLVRAGYRVSMICLDYGQPDRVVIDGVTVYKTHRPAAGLPGLRFIQPRLTSMWRVLRAVDADVYYQRTAAMLTGVVAAFCRLYGKRSIFAGASDPDFLPGRQDIRFRRDRWLFERGLATVDQVVVQNSTQQRYCQEHYGRSSVLIPSCYKLPDNARPGSGDTVLWVGTMRRSKRPEVFLELASRLPQFRFVMIGGPDGGEADVNYFDTLRRTALSMPNVEFTGFLPLGSVEPYFDRAAIFVNTSSHEGVPNTFLQAWARGVPTVAFIDIGARLQDKPIYHVAQDLTDAIGEIERLFSNELYRRRAADRCREYFAETHSPAGVLAHYQRLLAKLADQDSQ